MRAAVLFAQECWAKQSGSSWGVVTTFCHMSNVKQPSFLPNLKVLWIFQCLLNPCLRFWASFVCELVFRASLPSRACSVVCRTRVERVTLSRDKLGTRNWRVPFARLWARSLLRRAAQKKKSPFPRTSFGAVRCWLLCQGWSCQDFLSSAQSTRIYCTSAFPSLPPLSFCPFWKDWVCHLVLSVHCSCRMNLGWFLFFTLYTQQTA